MADKLVLTRRTFLAGSMGMLCTLPFVGCSTGATQVAADRDGATTGVSLDYVSEFDAASIMTVDITADANVWQDMLDNAIAEEYIEADIIINGTEVKQVGIRPKGNSSLSSIVSDPDSDRYSFKVKFNEYVDDQTWLGLDKIVLNSNWSDATSMKEYLSYDILSRVGVKTPLYNYARITLNGELWGLYLAIEVIDKSYRMRTVDGQGELYKPDSMDMGNMQTPEGMEMPDGTEMPERGQRPEGDGMSGGMEMPESGEMTDSLEIPEGGESANEDGMNARDGLSGGMSLDNGVALIYVDDNESSYSSIFDNAETNTNSNDHARVIEAIKNLNAGTQLETYVDVDACLRYFAGHTVVVSLDSYSGSMGHNYYLYENQGQISMLPWDYNMSFGGFQSGTASEVVNFPIDTPVSGVSMEDRPLISKLFEVPEYLEAYHEYMQSLMDEYFSNGAFEERVEEVHTLIKGGTQEDPTAFYSYEEYERAIEELKILGELRGSSIVGQLAGEIPSTTEGQEADTSALIDATSIDMSVLGDEMGGMGMGMSGGSMQEGMPKMKNPGTRGGTEGDTSNVAEDAV